MEILRAKLELTLTLPRQPILRRDCWRRAVRYPFLLYTLHHGSDPLHHRGELVRGDTRGVRCHVLVGVPTQHGFLEPLLTRRVRITTTHACAYTHTPPGVNRGKMCARGLFARGRGEGRGQGAKARTRGEGEGRGRGRGVRGEGEGEGRGARARGEGRG